MSSEKTRFCNLCAVAVGGAEANWTKHLSSKNHQKRLALICESCPKLDELEIEPIQCPFDGASLIEDFLGSFHCRYCHLGFSEEGAVGVWQNRIHDDYVDTTMGSREDVERFNAEQRKRGGQEIQYVEIPEKYRGHGFMKRNDLTQ